jgi:Ca2+-dependent lipid-binding protein
VQKSLNPYWNESFVLESPKPESDILVLKCYDYDTMSRNKLLGVVEVPVAKYYQSYGTVTDEWFQLMKRKGKYSRVGKGKLHVIISFGKPATGNLHHFRNN